ncbi:hypothetical protein B7P43_G01388 [Cryptotermes secundus]|uniref:Uncharacterized protein n=1 Tax=Cryptotermes secundus TaxID=105785 RepID=A0A2J7PRB7_9NEOP|nr:hypothetical protein B7P43_G01388 [Cryptotermes secundus]
MGIPDYTNKFCTILIPPLKVSIISIVTKLGTEGSTSGRGKDFFLHHSVKAAYEAHSPFHPKDIRGSFPGLEQPGSEADPLTNAEIKNALRYTSSPSYVFMV